MRPDDEGAQPAAAPTPDAARFPQRFGERLRAPRPEEQTAPAEPTEPKETP